MTSDQKFSLLLPSLWAAWEDRVRKFERKERRERDNSISSIPINNPRRSGMKGKEEGRRALTSFRTSTTTCCPHFSGDRA